MEKTRLEEIVEVHEKLKIEMGNDHPDLGFRVLVHKMEGLGFTFIKRETEVGFIKLIDKQGEGDVYEPLVIEAFEDIPQPRQWCNWVMASHQAAMKALEQYGEYLKDGQG